MQFGVTEIQVSSVISKQCVMQGVDYKHHMAIRSILLWLRSALLVVTTYCALAQNVGRIKSIQPCFLSDDANLEELFQPLICVLANWGH